MLWWEWSRTTEKIVSRLFSRALNSNSIKRTTGLKSSPPQCSLGQKNAMKTLNNLGDYYVKFYKTKWKFERGFCRHAVSVDRYLEWSGNITQWKKETHELCKTKGEKKKKNLWSNLIKWLSVFSDIVELSLLWYFVWGLVFFNNPYDIIHTKLLY